MLFYQTARLCFEREKGHTYDKEMPCAGQEYFSWLSRSIHPMTGDRSALAQRNNNIIRVEMMENTNSN